MAFGDFSVTFKIDLVLLFYFVLVVWIVFVDSFFVACLFVYFGLLGWCSVLIKACFLHASVPHLGHLFVNMTLTDPSFNRCL